MFSRRLAAILVASSATLAATYQGVAGGGDKQPAAQEKILFETHIAPILEARCVKCHGAEKTRAGLDLRRKFTMLNGGDSGPALVPGKPGDSILLQRVLKGEMPPPGEAKLDARQVDLLRKWVAAGAPLAKSPEAPLGDTAPA